MTTPEQQYALGALVRPRDVNEDKYSLSLVLPATAVDISQPRSLGALVGSDGQRHDYRPPVGNQGQIGSCASWSAVLAAQCARNLVGDTTVPLHGGVLYEQVRKKEGTFPQDAGSYLADNCDIAMVGVPPLSDGPYVENAAYEYPNSYAANAADYVLSHYPFYPSAPDFVQQLCNALDYHLPVQIGTAWPREWFSPVGGLVRGGTQQSVVGGHAVWVWGWEPKDGGHLLCANQWGTGWSADAAAFRADMRPGDFAIPLALFLQFGWEARAITAQPLPVPPQPEPPKPEPPKPQPQPKAVKIVSPAEQTTFTSTSVPVSFSVSPQPTALIVRAGTSVRVDAYFNSGAMQPVTRSVTVTGLPQDGSPVLVTLAVLFPDSVEVDAVAHYTAAGAPQPEPKPPVVDKAAVLAEITRSKSSVAAYVTQELNRLAAAVGKLLS